VSEDATKILIQAFINTSIDYWITTTHCTLA